LELHAKGNADLVGTKVTLEARGQRWTHFMKGGGSYLSACDPRQVFGLGKLTTTGRLTVTWSSGQPREQSWDNLVLDQYNRLAQGTPAVHQLRETRSKKRPSK
jgi:hypothetical protein